MSKSLIVCCDGIWSRSWRSACIDPPSNVRRLAQALQGENAAGPQILWYDSGRKHTGPIEPGRLHRLACNLLGLGVAQSIMNAYSFLVANWTPGDRIYLFGFSRGAYVVRSLAGLIHLAGLLPDYALPHLTRLYAYYRCTPGQRHRQRSAHLVHQLLGEVSRLQRRPRIEFVGVWDTVGADGVPHPGLRRVSRHWIGFHDTQLSSSVKRGVQALALNEPRALYRPDLWTCPTPSLPEPGPNPSPVQILQVWFRGTHPEAGGMRPRTTTGDKTLEFMLAEARQAGLDFDSSYLHQTTPPRSFQGSGPSRLTLAGRLFAVWRRPVGPSQRAHNSLLPAINERAHSSLLEPRLEGESEYTVLASNPIPQDMPVYWPRAARRQPPSAAQPRAVRCGNAGLGELLDFSATGARVRGGQLPPPGDAIVISHPAFGERQSTVCWQLAGQSGLRFAA